MAAASRWRAPGVAGRNLRPVPRARRRQRPRRRRRSPAQQRTSVVGAPLDRLDPTIGGASSLSLRADVTGKNDGVFHALQRQCSAAIAVGTAGPQRRVRPDTSALVRGRVRAQPHQRGLHHRLRRHASARHRRPARRSSASLVCSSGSDASLSIGPGFPRARVCLERLSKGLCRFTRSAPMQFRHLHQASCSLTLWQTQPRCRCRNRKPPHRRPPTLTPDTVIDAKPMAEPSQVTGTPRR